MRDEDKNVRVTETMRAALLAMAPQERVWEAVLRGHRNIEITDNPQAMLAMVIAGKFRAFVTQHEVLFQQLSSEGWTLVAGTVLASMVKAMSGTQEDLDALAAAVFQKSVAHVNADERLRIQFYLSEMARSVAFRLTAGDEVFDTASAAGALVDGVFVANDGSRN